MGEMPLRTHWEDYSPVPKITLTNEGDPDALGVVQEVQYGSSGTWDFLNAHLHFAALLTPVCHIAKPGHSPAYQVIPSSALAVPGTEIVGGWRGNMKGRHVFVPIKNVEKILGEACAGIQFRSHSFSRAGEPSSNDPVVENILKLLAHDVSYGPSEDSSYSEHLISALVVHATPRKEGSYAYGKTNIRQDPMVSRAISQIREELTTKLLLSDLAGARHVSISYFCRKFREQTGVTPHQFILRERLERSLALITNTETSIAEVALMAGFADQSQFTTTFKRFTGVSPAKYRKSVF